MKRKEFIKQTSMTAAAVFVFGKVSIGETSFVGDNPTTTDVLGPFYRPGSPIRKNINPSNYTGHLFHLSGTVFKEDGKTPLKNCKIEIWQCDENQKYDNITDEYKYRGSQITGKDGKYHFITMHPIPYPATDDPNRWRTPHIHLLVTVDGQQDLITQIFFKGADHLETDGPASAKDAANRILTISKNQNGEETVVFDIVMAKELKLTDAGFERITGIYKMTDKSFVEFYRKGDLLFIKRNGQIIEGLFCKEANTFIGGSGQKTVARFQLVQENMTKVFLKYYRPTYNETVELEGVKSIKYKE